MRGVPYQRKLICIKSQYTVDILSQTPVHWRYFTRYLRSSVTYCKQYRRVSDGVATVGEFDPVASRQKVPEDIIPPNTGQLVLLPTHTFTNSYLIFLYFIFP